MTGGCSHPLDVIVVDANHRTPIAGATVTRMGLKRPYFIVGAIRPAEKETTDASGAAHFRGRGGWLSVAAPG